MVSEKYIEQLLSDIKNAYKKDHTSSKDENPNNLPFIVDATDDDDIEKHFEEVERYLEFDYDNEPSFGSIIGLEVIQFPKAELLTYEQVSALHDAFINLLVSHNITLDIPEELPVDKAYSCAVSVLDDAIFLSDEGQIGWDLCTGDCDTCPYEDHCHCIEMEREFEQNLEEARQLLIDIKEGCEEQFALRGKSQLVITSETSDEAFTMDMYIAAGSDYVPTHIYQQADYLETACSSIKKLFEDNDVIAEAFSRIENFKVHFSLEALLSLKVIKSENNIFYVEPFYIEDSIMKKGHEPRYTPEELMDKIESESSSLFWSENDDDMNNSKDENDIPF